MLTIAHGKLLIVKIRNLLFRWVSEKYVHVFDVAERLMLWAFITNKQLYVQGVPEKNAPSLPCN